MTGEESLAILQRYVDNYADDLGTVLSAVDDATTPAAAKRPLVAALAYSVDAFDFFPDTTKGLGTTDDAIILRLAARAATRAGAKEPSLTKLAGDATEIAQMFGELAPALEELLGKLCDRQFKGKTADQVLASKDAQVMLAADVGREQKRYKPHPIERVGGPERALIEVKKMFEHAIKKAK
jgi:uncharacterized membrane protein YkvA (DUF1232 family)